MRSFFLRGLLWLVALAMLAVAIASLWQQALDRYGGYWRYALEDASWVLSADARRLIEQSFAGAGKQPVIDHGLQVLTWGDLSGADFDNTSQPAGGDRPEPLTWLARRALAGRRHHRRQPASRCPGYLSPAAPGSCHAQAL